MNLPHSFHFQRRILKSNFKKLKTNVLPFAWTFLGDFISIHYTLEKYTGFWLATEWKTILWIPIVGTEMELYQDIFMKFLSLHSEDLAQDHRSLSLGQKYCQK